MWNRETKKRSYDILQTQYKIFVKYRLFGIEIKFNANYNQILLRFAVKKATNKIILTFTLMH